jgi:D-methionine transport system substrate-binding protein
MTSSNQQPADTGSSQEPVRVNHTARNIIITVVVIAVLAVAVFFGYRAIAGKSDSAAKGSQSNPVKIGVVGATEPQWIAFTKKGRAGEHPRQDRRLPGLHLGESGA